MSGERIICLQRKWWGCAIREADEMEVELKERAFQRLGEIWKGGQTAGTEVWRTF